MRNIKIAVGQADIQRQLEALRDRRTGELFLCDLRGGILAFAQSVFPSLTDRVIYAQHFMRAPAGRGAHFDVYSGLLDPLFPWVAVLNLAGECAVQAFTFPDDLAAAYFEQHPKSSDAAYAERRRLSALAQSRLTSPPIGGPLCAGCGLVIPQSVAGPHWVHEVTPLRRDAPGHFIKLVVPATSTEAQTAMMENGYAPLDGVLTAALTRIDAVPQMNSEDAERHPRRCNLD